MENEAKINVIAVDDEPLYLTLINGIVGTDANVHKFTDPFEAINLFEKTPELFPLIFTDKDYKRTDINGLTFAQRIREISALRLPDHPVRIVMITGDYHNSTPEDWRRVQKEFGIDAVRPKPFPIKDMMDEVLRIKERLNR